MTLAVAHPVPAAPAPTPPPVRHRRVLVWPGGTEIGLEIRAALAWEKGVELVSANIDLPSHAPYAFARNVVLPSVHEEGWVDALAGVIRREGIDVVYPAHDDVLVALAERAAEVPAGVVASPAETCRITRSKSLTYRRLAGAVPVPEVIAGEPPRHRYPLFAKPDRGQGSAGARRLDGPDDLRRARAEGAALVTEYLPGEECTVDCFSDRERGLLAALPRRRDGMRAGIAMRSVPVEDAALRDYAVRIAERLELHGAWFFQTRRDRAGIHRLLEVAPRVAGTMALHRGLGVNFALLSLLERERVPVELAPNAMALRIDRALVNRYRHDLRFRAVYVDLDDTLIVRGAVNADLVRVLYQCLNAGRRLVLLTRHRGDLDATLARHRLAGLWDRVVRVADGAAKADHIEEADAILIDDSFSERMAAHHRLGIPTFDCSMIEVLADDRV